ncbi:LPP20 family lipoprotein [Marinospirillum sp. MEB164]|uniref:LPP20 family lipoprotein n=1 Tax=Marinospirillum alkalitolerans TaxID=3123374 RepID=A0ABW8PUW6_9GAMM
MRPVSITPAVQRVGRTVSASKLWAGASALALALMLGGCATSPSSNSSSAALSQAMQAGQPSWVRLHPQRAGYVYGVASAEIYGSSANALERARQQAQVDLLARIQVSVAGETQTTTRAEMRQGQLHDLHEILLQQASSRVEEVTLPGIQVTETWIDEAGRSAWALAELNRQAAETQLLAQLQQVDQRLLQRALPTSGDQLSRVRAVLPNLADLQQRRQLFNQLEFLAATGRIDAQRQQQVEAREAEIRGIIAALSFRLEAKSPDAQRMQPHIAARLTELGFQLRQNQADLTLRLNIHLQDVQRQGLHHRVAQADGQVVDAQGATLYAVSETGRAASTDAAVATSNAIQMMANSLAEALAQGLYQQR